MPLLCSSDGDEDASHRAPLSGRDAHEASGTTSLATRGKQQRDGAASNAPRLLLSGSCSRAARTMLRRCIPGQRCSEARDRNRGKGLVQC
jgi:hypothetical protein